MHTISFIIPAFNEQALIAACVNSIEVSLETIQRGEFSSEIIVVDNHSSDATAAIAKSLGATVVFEPVNQISRARNAGAAVASGDWLIFIDADCELNPELLADVIGLIESGKYIGCGSTMQMPGLPLWARGYLALWTRISITLSWAAGSFIACDARAFKATGGFSKELYVAEEIHFSRRIKRLARLQGSRFIVLASHPLYTSNRKLQLYSGYEMFKQIMRLTFRPRKTMRDKARLKIWYDGKR